MKHLFQYKENNETQIRNMQKKQVTLNGIKVFPFISAQELLQYVNSGKES